MSQDRWHTLIQGDVIYGIHRKAKNVNFTEGITPSNRPVSEVSEECGVSAKTVYRWMANLKEEKSSFALLEPTIPIRKSNLEKFSLLLESKTISEDKFGEWLRLKGLHTEHLNVWEREESEYHVKQKNKHRRSTTRKQGT